MPLPHFTPHAYILGAYVDVAGKLLLMQLSPIKQQPGFWGVPAGKREPEEPVTLGLCRELREETGIQVSPMQIRSLGMLYMRTPTLSYIYHLFHVPLSTLPTVQLSEEHTDYRWVDKKEQNTLPLMHGAKAALDYYYQYVEDPEISFKHVNDYLKNSP